MNKTIPGEHSVHRAVRSRAKRKLQPHQRDLQMQTEQTRIKPNSMDRTGAYAVDSFGSPSDFEQKGFARMASGDENSQKPIPPTQNVKPARTFAGRSPRARRTALFALTCLLLGMLTASLAMANSARMRVGFIYSGPVGDTGWNYAHERARLLLSREFPEVESIPVQSVPPDDAGVIMENLIHQGVRAIFATSRSFEAGVRTLAPLHPGVHFFLCNGSLNLPNVSNYFGRIYQPLYLCGMLAAGMSRRHHIGFLGNIRSNDTKRQLNAFVLGARRIDPDIRVSSAWTGDWYAPEKACRLVERFARERVDVYLNRVDSSRPLQTAGENGMLGIGFATDMSPFLARAPLTSAIWRWEVPYRHFFTALTENRLEAGSLWWGMDSGIVDLGTILDRVPEALLRRVSESKTAIIKGETEIFAGPLYDQDGRLRVPPHQVADDTRLRSMDWLLYGLPKDFEQTPDRGQATRVFIVQSYEDDHVCGIPQEEGIKSILEQRFDGRMVVKTHYMNTKTVHSAPLRMRADAAMVRREIEAFRPHLVFTIDDNAFREVGLQLAGKPFPVVFSGLNNLPENYNRKVHFLDSRGRPVRNITGVYEKLHLQTALRVMKGVFPHLRKVVALLDDTPTGRAIRQQIRKEMAENLSGVTVEIRTVKTLAGYLEQIRRINEDPVVQAVYPVVLSVKDAAGRSIGSRETLRTFLKQCRKPGIPINFAFAKQGVFGGASVDFAAMGRQAGKIGVRLLQGQNINQLPVESAQQSLIAFNTARARMLGISIPPEILATGEIFSRVELLDNEPQTASPKD
jgi:basic membrane lipoprotein Med (substrate-binding protein (PBP1-ABC) superfamily)/ABC-type uncharacterized transport system substrate-binding protein